ncbi:MAG: hypothetical protein Q9218_004461 [Villophora microphyllina]
MSAQSSPQDTSEKDRSIWDDTETYYPLFCLADAPQDYFDEINANCPGQASWLEISSNTQDYPQLLSEIKSHLGKDNIPIPFLGSTVPSVYAYFKDHLRQPEDSISHHPFTHFTFLAVDAECFRPSSSDSKKSSYTILLCSDAPDFHESDDSVRLKTLRLPIPAALEDLDMVEGLLMTPSEVYKGVFEEVNPEVLRIQPPAWFFPKEPIVDYPSEQVYRRSTPAEARFRKKQGLRIAETSQQEEGNASE